jgi:translation elongation factor EF-Ts
MEEILNKRCRNIDEEISIRRMVGWKNKEQWQKIGTYMDKYERKRNRMARTNEKEVYINL